MTCDTPKYLTGSFKGVEFSVDNNDDTFDRGHWVGEYPFRNDGSTTDTGLKVKKFSVKGTFLGGDHIVRASALRAVYEAGGDGILVHPVWGPIRVLAISLKFSHNVRDKARQSEFTLECIEAGSLFALITVGVGASSVSTIFDSVLSAAISYFNDTWNSNSDVQIAHDISMSAINYNSPMSSTIEYTNRDWLRDLPVAWSYDHEAMINRLSTMIIGVNDKPNIPFRVKNFVSSIPSTVPSGPNAKATNALYTVSIISSLQVFANYMFTNQYGNISEAWSDMEWMLNRFDTELMVASSTCNHELYSSIFYARSSVLSLILGKIVSLPGVVEFNIGLQLPSLVVAHRIYGDSKRAVEIQGYNPHSNPIAMNRLVWGESK